MIFKPPQQIQINKSKKSIFLAGTIDNGNSEDWQKLVENYLLPSTNPRTDIDIYNPRREKWNTELKNSFETPQFFQQVNWELDAMKKADIIIMNFAPNSQSPITLLELGLFANSEKLVVACPDEYWRAGNVQIICNNYNIPLYRSISDLLKNLKL